MACDPTSAQREELTVTAERMVAGGDALARHDGMVVFVDGALPGERVRVAIRERRRDHARATVVAIDDPHPARVAPPCPALARGCGGCSWQHAAPSLQVEMKRDIVVDALRRLGKIAAPPVVIGPTLPASGFRTVVRAGVRDGVAGLRRRAGHDLVVPGSCLVAHPLVDELLRVGRYHGARQVTVRCGAATGERLVLAESVSRRRPVTVEVPDHVVVATADAGPTDAAIHEAVAGRHWRISATSFFQTRTDGAAALVTAVAAAAGGPARRLVDAYAGVGLLGGALAEQLQAEHLVAVESHPAAAADARVNLADLPARVVEREVAAMPALAADLVIADPARPGLGAAAAARVVGTGAPRIVLVSCDPASLGRDARLLADAGYTLTSATVVDLFPHTPHVEVVSAFESRSSHPGAHRAT